MERKNWLLEYVEAVGEGGLKLECMKMDYCSQKHVEESLAESRRNWKYYNETRYALSYLFSKVLPCQRTREIASLLHLFTARNGKEKLLHFKRKHRRMQIEAPQRRCIRVVK